ncbi:MAG: hypothetical protein V1717_02645, partial [Candidatus Micrarchaeota archaeon]
LFIMGNVALFQPWAWDNTKIFLHFFLFASIATALFLNSLLESKKFRVASKAIVAAIVFLSIASGVLALFWVSWGDNARYEVFSKKDFVLAEWVGKNTPQDALFVSSQVPQNPVLALAGRKLVAGYDGWLWSHGLNYSKKLDDSRVMFSKADCRLFAEYGVDFVFTRSWESQNATVFQNNPSFKVVYKDSLGNKIFSANCVV